MGASSNSRRERWAEVVAITGKCPFCPPHDGENRAKRQRTDRHKSRRKGRSQPTPATPKASE
jgi:hypothetical protein